MTARIQQTPPASSEVSQARRWAMLGVGTLAQAAAAAMIHGPVFLIPALRDTYGLSLAASGLVAAASTLGVVLTLVAWGAVVDARGERFGLVVGLAGAVAAGSVAALLGGVGASPWWIATALFVAGASAASTASASGRVVVGWFPPHRRGLAMGVRQMAQPLGVGAGAVGIAALADRYGVGTALLLPTALCLLAGALAVLLVLDAPRPARPRDAAQKRASNPYRADSYLARIHGVSVLLVVPQFLVWTFSLVWLVDDRGWSPAAAGLLVGATQVVGALGRIAVGQVSDMVGSRMRPLQWVAALAAAAMLLLGATAGLGWSVALVAMVLATVVTVADNGLAFTAVAERAGPFWSGRALGLQNTAQYLTASAVPPVAGLAVAAFGYAGAFAVAAVFPLLALPLVPRAGERELT